MIRERQTYIDVLRMTCMICVISFHIFGRLDDLFRDSFLDNLLYSMVVQYWFKFQ